MRKITLNISLFSLFAAAAIAENPENVWSIENADSFSIEAGKHVIASGYYYNTGEIHRGPVYNVGNFTIDGTFESKYTAAAQSLLDAKNILGSGELKVASALFLSPASDMSAFDGKVSIYKAHETQNPTLFFVSSANKPSSASFDIAEGGNISFTNGNYELNGKISGSGTVKAEKLSNITLADGTEIVKDASAANVVIKGDTSEFNGVYQASSNSSIRLETSLPDSVRFSGSTGGTLELVGDGQSPKKEIKVSSSTNTTTSGNVFMYGNTPIIEQNSNAEGTLGDNGGTIYFGGRNEYAATEKISHTFDSSTVLGNTAGKVAIGGKGVGASMEAGADIVVDGVKIDSLIGGGTEGASVNGDINITVKSGELTTIAASGSGGSHTGNTTVNIDGGSVKNLYAGDQKGGDIKGDINVNVNGGTVGTIYGSNYNSTSETAENFQGVDGNVNIKINGGQVNHIRGGINSNNAGDVATAKEKMVLNGNVVVNVGGDAHIGALDGESILATGGSYGSVNGNTTVNISDNAVIDGIIAGGASRTDDKGVKSTYINVSGGTLNGDVYGGGLKYSTVLENTNINISGGEINGDVYGGGSVGTSVEGNSNITITGSSAVINGTLNGGGLDGGVVEGKKVLNIGTSAESYSGTSTLKVADFDNINVSKDSSAKIESISQDLTGSIDGTRTSIAKGGKLEVVGDITNNINNGTNSGSFVGGVTGGDGIVGGTVKTVIDGADTSMHFVYGGNGGNQQTVLGRTVPIGESSVGAVDLTVNNGKIDMIIASGAMYSDVAGDVNVNINGGNISDIYGSASGAEIGGNVNISVKNASVNSITAGGSGTNKTASVINGSTNIVLGQGAVVSTDVYGGGWGDGASWPTLIKGNSNITLVGNASVGGTINGGGWDLQYDVVEGEKILNIGTSAEAYVGDSAIKAANFDKINVAKGSEASLSGLKADNSAKMALNVEGSASLSDSVYEGLEIQKEANGSPSAIITATNNSTLSISDSSFKNNLASTSGVANGTYGVAVGISSSNASIDNVVFENNTNKSTGNLMSQGVVYMTGSESTTIKDSKFNGNSSVSETYALGGAISSFGSNLDIDNTAFNSNTVKGVQADGSALYVAGNDWGGVDKAVVNISNSSFEGNVSEGSSIARGAVFAGGDNPNTLTLNISDTQFNNNVAKGDDYVAGGAISVQDQKVNINVSKDMTYAGNQAIVNGVSDDSKGGFLFINSKNVSSDTSFNIAAGATLTIGDGTAGRDSIASSDNTASIAKNGLGILTVNSSMEYFTGSLSVNDGEMNVSDKLGASSITIASDAVLRLSVGDEAVLSNENLLLSNAGTLALIKRGSSSAKVAAASGLNYGNVEAYGGKFDALSGTFVSDYNTENAYGDMSMATVQGAGTMKFGDGASAVTLMTQSDTAFGENVRNDAVAADFFGDDLLAAWTVNYNSEDTVVLSFIADGDMAGKNLYHQDSSGTWIKLDSWLEDGSLNTITGEIGNFAIAVPEPSVIASIFGVIALIAAFSRRKKI